MPEALACPKIPVGKKSRMCGRPRLRGERPKLFRAGEGLQRTPRDASPNAPERPRLPARAGFSARIFGAVFVHFTRCFAAVTRMAKALEVATVTEFFPVALVIDDVVDVRGADAAAEPRAFAAEGLEQ